MKLSKVPKGFWVWLSERVHNMSTSQVEKLFDMIARMKDK